MYFVTMFKHKRHDSWTIGMYDNRNEAVEDLHMDRVHPGAEGYHFAVLEEYRDTGLFPSVSSRTFFQWNPERKGFYEISAPTELAKVTNFAIG